MYKKVVPLDIRTHKGKRIRQVDSFKFAENLHMVPIIANEFKAAASIYPIVFIEEEGNMTPFVLLGLTQGKNLFVNADGSWEASFIPSTIRRYPFVLGRHESQGGYILCVDEESGFLSDDEGEPLVDEDGNPGKVAEEARKYLAELFKMKDMTKRFCQDLHERGLITPLNFHFKDASGNMRQIDGCCTINEEKLNALSDEDFLEFRRRGGLPLVYCQLLSIAQIDRLVKMNTQRGGS